MKKILFLIIILLNSSSVLSNSFIPNTQVDRITGKTITKYSLVFNTRQYKGIDYDCDVSSKCQMTMGENFIFLNGYSLLAADSSIVKNTKVRIRIGNNVYNGTCEYTKEGNGCLVSSKIFLVFNTFDIKKVINEILNTKGYFAIEVTQDFYKKDVVRGSEIWFTTLQ